MAEPAPLSDDLVISYLPVVGEPGTVGSADAQLEIDVDQVGDSTLELVAQGALDENTVHLLREGGLGRGDDSADRLLVNLSNVEHIDDAGLAALLLARIEIEARGGAMVIFASEGQVAGALQKAGFRRFVDVARSRPAALRMLASA
jgi:anti-anti-sigma factor